MEYISRSEKETYSIADKVASYAKPGDVFALFGDLGSGKTTFTKGFAAYLGVKKNITSPTFVISKEYLVSSSSIKKLVHVDCYRLGGENDAESVGLNEHIDAQDTVLILEWPEKIEKILPRDVKKIYFEYIDEKTRKITTGNLKPETKISKS